MTPVHQEELLPLHCTSALRRSPNAISVYLSHFWCPCSVNPVPSSRSCCFVSATSAMRNSPRSCLSEMSHCPSPFAPPRHGSSPARASSGTPAPSATCERRTAAT
eukprot:CAMPEP_0179188628 /NCGR_PEP_ID=MMETSP0796-20121207/93624_1 /TAXON_ID=73915 /ORGANISM="Pyrodinium bahamense, Strain pbaha01" /LENGTH=104 /DNA_ID=CAMNT_0020892737 /DNA_START=303 /DNA_END=614 /DNA_ORIENTATION=+